MMACLAYLRDAQPRAGLCSGECQGVHDLQGRRTCISVAFELRESGWWAHDCGEHGVPSSRPSAGARLAGARRRTRSEIQTAT